MLAEVAALFDDIVDVLVLDAEGRTVCSAEGAVGVPVTAAQVRGQGVLLSPVRGQPVIALTSAFGAVAAPLAGSMQLLLAESRLQKMAAGSAASGVRIALLTTDGRVLALAPSQPQDAAAADSDPESVLLAEAARAGRTSVRTFGADGLERFHAVRMVAGTNLLVAAGLQVDEAFHAARGQALRSLAVVAVGVLLAALLLASILRRISGPMTALARTAEAVAGGDLARRAPEAGPVEVARVAVEFNRMLDRLPALEQAVLESEERHRTLLHKLSSNIPGTLFQLCLAPDGRLWMPFASEAIEAMFEVTPQEASADANAVLRRIHPDDLPGFEDALHGPDRLLRFRVLRYRVLLSSRGLRHYLMYAQPELQADGAVLWHGCTVDVTPQEEARLALRQANETLEARVAERTRALAAANESLESFSYSVAHDLRAPLAAIEGFTGALAGVLERGDRERLARLSDRIAANTRQMGAMIDGLLDIARAGKGELQEAAVPMQAMVAGVLAEVAPRASMELVVGPLPVVRGDPATLRQVWWNLLANAAKFTARRDHGRIEVACREQDGELLFMVRDNGAGFDPQYAGRLFTAFQRLHDASDFEGTGIGLALVRRVVERHGGRTWAEARPEQGACFWFTLPASRLLAAAGSPAS